MSAKPAIPSPEVVQIIRDQADTVCLSFSCGKDSLASWIVLRDAGFKVIPIFHYHIPDLEFVEVTLRRAEEHFGERIIRIPHATLYQRLAWCAFQPPHNVPLLEAYGYETNATLENLKRSVLQDLGEQHAWIAVGTRAADSTMRRRMFGIHGSIRQRLRTFFPVWDWKQGRVFEAIEADGFPLPDDYKIWGRSFDGVDYFFLKGVREHYPDDYERIKAWHPLIDLEFARKEMAMKEADRRTRS
jgi:3'-phosphoadenosine 5'-phosphosulfate sulfotransferase (PAPS reductase)/FAD synthetase